MSYALHTRQDKVTTRTHGGACCLCCCFTKARDSHLINKMRDGHNSVVSFACSRSAPLPRLGHVTHPAFAVWQQQSALVYSYARRLWLLITVITRGKFLKIIEEFGNSGNSKNGSRVGPKACRCETILCEIWSSTAPSPHNISRQLTGNPALPAHQSFQTPAPRLKSIMGEITVLRCYICVAVRVPRRESRRRPAKDNRNMIATDKLSRDNKRLIIM